MAIVNVDPSTLGSFVPDGIVLQHKDEVIAAQWNKMVQNGVRSYSIQRSAMASSRSLLFGTSLWCCIPPSNPSVYWAGGPSENASLQYTIQWFGTPTTRGTVTFRGGTNIASLGTLGTYITSGASGSTSAAFATPVIVPDYELSGGVVRALPYFVRIDTNDPSPDFIYFAHISFRYLKYPMIY
jgi:hypothetical protein